MGTCWCYYVFDVYGFTAYTYVRTYVFTHVLYNIVCNVCTVYVCMYYVLFVLHVCTCV